MAKQKIISREYKLVLQKAHFAGDESAVQEKANAFLNTLGEMVNVVTKGKNFSTIKHRRQIRFYDTAD